MTIMDNNTITTDDIKPMNTQSHTQNGIGSRFKTAREAMGLSEKDAAQHLHLHPKIITLIENEDFENISLPATFLRGHLRSYARLLNINEEEIKTTLTQLGMDSSEPTSIKSSLIHNTPINNTSDGYLRWLTYLIVLVLFVLVGVWWNSHPRDVITRNAMKIEPQPTTPPSSTDQASPTTIMSLTPAEPQVSTPLPPTSSTTATISDSSAEINTPTEPMVNPFRDPSAEVTPENATLQPTDTITAPETETAPVKKPKRHGRSLKPKAVDENLPQLNMSLPNFD